MKQTARAIRLRDYAPGTERFLEDVLSGLRRPRKRIPCKYFYDERGSRLFERICDLDKYYLTRTELAIMDRHAGEMAAALGPGVLLIEYGSGSGRKTRLLLDHLEAPAGYVPIDISSEALEASARRLAAEYPSLEVLPVCADYTAPFRIPRPARPPTRRAVYFPGSTIGNFSPAGARRFLSHIARVVGPGGGLIVGMDLRKDPAVLEAAYDDAAGVTAAFNLNLLTRINRELGGNLRMERFRHMARYNTRQGRIEIHIVSRVEQTVTIAGERIHFRAGEKIHTEYSYKFDPAQVRELAARAGLTVRKVWTDPKKYFSVQYLTVGRA